MAQRKNGSKGAGKGGQGKGGGGYSQSGGGNGGGDGGGKSESGSASTWTTRHLWQIQPVRDVLLRLQDAGLDSIPGGGAEILVDRVREKIAQGKTTTEQYLHVMRQAHRIGMRTSVTMMFGHIETIPERIEHFRRIREVQDETGGFTAFICWTFQPGNTPLGRVPPPPPDDDGPPDGQHLRLADAHEYLRTLAMARLYLDNIPNLQASWVTQGVKIGELALLFGANDMGSVMLEENVVSAAGTTYRLTEQEIKATIRDAGWVPKKRNFHYQIIDGVAPEGGCDAIC